MTLTKDEVTGILMFAGMVGIITFLVGYIIGKGWG